MSQIIGRLLICDKSGSEKMTSGDVLGRAGPPGRRRRARPSWSTRPPATCSAELVDQAAAADLSPRAGAHDSMNRSERLVGYVLINQATTANGCMLL